MSNENVKDLKLEKWNSWVKGTGLTEVSLKMLRKFAFCILISTILAQGIVIYFLLEPSWVSLAVIAGMWLFARTAFLIFPNTVFWRRVGWLMGLDISLFLFWHSVLIIETIKVYSNL